MSGSRQFLTFWVGRSWLGIDPVRVQEVIRGGVVRRVPLAPPGILGLLNLRGEILTVYDLRVPLGVEGGSREDGASHIVVRGGGAAVSLAVDAIGPIVEADEASMDRVPETVPAEVRDLSLGTCKLDTGLLLLLDIDRAAAAAAPQES